MPRFGALRQCDPSELLHGKTTASARAAGFAVDLGSLVMGREYLHFDLIGPHAVTPCAVDAQAWAAIRLPELSGVDWSLIDTAIARSLLADFPAPLAFTQGAPFADIRFTHLARPDDIRHVPTIKAVEGDVFLLGSWGGALRGETVTAACPGLPVRIEFCLGVVATRRDVLRRLGVGDLLLVPQHAFVAMTSRRTLFTFMITKEGLTVDQLTPQICVDSVGEHETSGSERLDVARVPVMIDVVLCHGSYPLHELAGVAPGTVFPLTEESFRKVQLRVAGQLFATGELVEIGAGLGVQIDRILAL